MKIAISFSIIAVAICLLATSCASAEQIQLSIKYKEGQDTTYTERLHMKGGHAQLVIDTLRLKEMKEVKVSPVRGHVKAGKEGYYVTGSSMQVKFLPREYDSHLNAVEFPLPLSMTKTGNQLLMGINKGMKWECRQRVTYTKGNVVIKAKKKAKAGKTYNVVLKYKKGKKQVKKIVKVKVK